MGRYALEHEVEDAVDLFAIDTEFDEPGSNWGDRADLLYAVNESAIAWRSQFSMEDFDADY